MIGWDYFYIRILCGIGMTDSMEGWGKCRFNGVSLMMGLREAMKVSA